jgi:SAM-dependent methyltransferase
MKSKYIEQYEALEKNHWWWIARRRIIRSILRQQFQTQPEIPRLLDIGCGAGVQLSLLKDFEVVGVEPDPVLAQRARINSGAEIINASLPLSSISLREFDVILMLDVLEHLTDDLGALQSVKRYLKPTGFMILNVPAGPRLWSIHDVVNEHKRRYTRAHLKKLLQSADLMIQKIHYWGSFLVPAAYWQRRGDVSIEEYRVSVPSPLIAGILSRISFLDYLMNAHICSVTGLSVLAVAKQKLAATGYSPISEERR